MNKQRFFLSLTTIVLASFLAAPCMAMDQPGSSMPAAQEKSSISARPEYTVNLMWINKKLNDKQLYIHPSQDKESLQANFLDPIFRWAAVSQGGAVNVWFDSKVTSAQAVENTQALIEEYIKEYPGMAPIKLRDVRTLPEVVQHPEVFSEKTPVYFRADLIRAIAGLHMISTKETPYFVYADLDVEPLSQEQLFDYETQRNLQKYGMVMARRGRLGFENGFQMVSGQKANLLRAMKWVLIELNIARAKNALRGDFLNICGRWDPKGPTNPLAQVIYDSYEAMFLYFYHLEGYTTLRVDGEVYHANKHGFEPFGLHQWHYVRHSLNGPSTPSNGWNNSISLLPTKEVSLPPRHSGGYDIDPDPANPKYADWWP